MDGVLCHLDDEIRIGHLSTLTGLAHDHIWNAIWTSGFEDQSDEGVYSAEEYLEGFGKRLQRPISLDDWVAYRKSGMTPILPMLDVAREVSRSLATCVLTNNGLLLEHEIGRIFPELGPIFGPRIWSSAGFQCRKPSPEIYLKVCQRLGCPPERTLMVDDRPENIDGAQRAGLQGHLFVDVEQLRQSLLA